MSEDTNYSLLLCIDKAHNELEGHTILHEYIFYCVVERKGDIGLRSAQHTAIFGGFIPSTNGRTNDMSDSHARRGHNVHGGLTTILLTLIAQEEILLQQTTIV